jgi:hypothetical protein
MNTAIHSDTSDINKSARSRRNTTAMQLHEYLKYTQETIVQELSRHIILGVFLSQASIE